LNYIDLFSGSGGMSLGFETQGFENLFAIEFDEATANTYRRNFPDNYLIEKDITQVTNQEILDIVEEVNVDVVIGGPPCQGFSIAGNIGRQFIDDERNHLFKEFVRIVDIIKPKMFVMENVARLATHNKGKTIKEICDEFEKIGYHTKFKVLNAVNFNVPQNRRRIFVVGTKENEFEFPAGNDYKMSVKETIGDLPPLENGEKSDIPNHFAMKHTSQMLKKMSYISDGGDRNEIPEELRPKSGDIRKYIKFDSSQPAVTVTGDMRKVFHYDQNRALSSRELARLQTFPDTFVFEGSSISTQQQIGNAVPPNLSKGVAKNVKRSLLGTKKMEELHVS